MDVAMAVCCPGQLFVQREIAGVQFQGLVVLAFDLQFGLQLLYQQFEASDFCAQLIDFHRW